jgi:hypothetical protein
LAKKLAFEVIVAAFVMTGGISGGGGVCRTALQGGQLDDTRLSSESISKCTAFRLCFDIDFEVFLPCHGLLKK